MAFNPALLVQLQPSSLFTEPATIPSIAVSPLPPQAWLYNANNDASATVMAAGYFNIFADWTPSLQYNNGQYFRVGDSIYCVCSDINVTLYVSAIGSSITTIVLPTGPLSVTTGDIVNLAVTAAKIANATITTTQISGSAAILGTQLSATAAILGTQLAASAAILGSQLSATAGIVGTQLQSGTITATQLANSVPQNIRVPITSANFKTSYTAGLAMIAGVASSIIVISSVTYSFGYLTAAYTAGGAIGLQYSTSAPVNAGGVAASATVAATDVTGLSAAGYESAAGSLAINAATIIGQGVWFTVATQNFASGSGALVANIAYRVISP